MSFSPQRSRVGSTPSNLPSNGGAQGSVRAARERMAAQSGAGTREVVREAPGRAGQSSLHSPLSRQRTYEDDYDYQEPNEGSQWPLPASRYDPNASRRGHKSRTGANLDAPSMSTASSNVPQTFFDASQDYASDGPQSPRTILNQSRLARSRYESAPGPDVPRRAISAASTSSGGIPDFPLPASQYQSGRQSQNLLAPSRSRRGPSSYYSQLSAPYGVSPIPEESPGVTRANTNSYASSNVIPSQMPVFYLEETPSDDETSQEFDWEKEGERVQTASPALVRQASLGKRGKPSLTTIISSDTLRAPAATGMGTLSKEAPGTRGARISQSASILDSRSMLFDASSSEHDRQSALPPDLPSPFDRQNLGFPFAQNTLKPSIAERRNKNNVLGATPRSIDVDAIKEAEARASLTSLPDLIRRATRLAANLDRGKTASRLGMDWMGADDEKPRRGYNARQSQGSSLSGILAHFPPVSRGSNRTPINNLTTVDEMKYRNTSSRGRGSSRNKKKGRQVCGMSVTAFVLCVVVVVLLVAAAVVLPVVLIVLPNQNKAASDSAVPLSGALKSCAESNPCANGGTVVINLDDSCGCICTNGFTGPQCATQSNTGCANLRIGGTQGASVGTSIPDLITAGQQTFGIPLDAAALTSAFSANNMSCTTENALVTFQGSPNAKRLVTEGVESATEPVVLERRTESEYTAATAAASPTDAAESPATTPAETTQDDTTATGTPSNPTSSTPIVDNGASENGVNSTTKQFAQVGVLFVLQDSKDLPTAVEAQQSLTQYLLSTAQRASGSQLVFDQGRNITLGEGYLIDLLYYTITLKDGRQYGRFNQTSSSGSS